MSAAMGNLSCSLGAALSWGIADFAGGQATKKGNVFFVVMLVEAVGLVLMVGLGLLEAEPAPAAEGLFWAVNAGLVNGVGLVCFYRALATGKMGINASLTGLLATLIPVLVGGITQGQARPLQLLGIGAGMLSTPLISVGDFIHRVPGGLGLAIAAGISFGGFLVFSKMAGEVGLFWILAVMRAASLLLMLGVFLTTGTRRSSGRPQLLIPCLAGLLDGLGGLFYVTATRSGRLDISAVLCSLYSPVTVLLALVFLKERLSLRQGVGVGAALAAILLMAHG